MTLSQLNNVRIFKECKDDQQLLQLILIYKRVTRYFSNVFSNFSNFHGMWDHLYSRSLNIFL